jgi:hypothetical protein
MPENTTAPPPRKALSDYWHADKTGAPAARSTSQNGAQPPLSVAGANPTYVQKAVDAELEALRSTPEGGRNNALNTAAYNLGQLVGGRELTEAEVEQLLSTVGREIGLSDPEIFKTVNSGISAGAKQPRTAPPPTMLHVPAVTVLENGAAPDETPERTSWWPQPIAERAAAFAETPAPNQLRRDDGECLFYSGKVNGIIGESESGKSWIALLAIVQALIRVERVLILDFEDSPSSIYRRLQQLGVEDDKLPLVHYADPDEALGLLQRNDLIEALGVGYSIIVLDGVNAAMTLLGYDLNSNTDATLFATLLLRPLAHTGSCVITVDHVPKNPDGRNKGGIGAQAKRAMITGCQLVAEVAEPFGKGQDGAIKLLVDKDKNGIVRGMSSGGKYAGKALVESSADSVRIKISAPTLTDRAEQPDTQADWAPTIVMEKISMLLERLTEPCSFRSIKFATTGKDETIRKAIDVLHRRGYMEITSGPRGSTLHRSVRPYRAPDSDTTHASGASTVHRVPSVSPSVSGHGEVNVSTVSTQPPLYEGGGHGTHSRVAGTDEKPTVSRDTLDIPDGFSHCNDCGELTAEAEIEVNAGYCNSCQRSDA